MKLTRQGYNSFSLEGLTLRELFLIAHGVVNDKPQDAESKSMDSYFSNCNIWEAIADNNPNYVNAIKTREG